MCRFTSFIYSCCGKNLKEIEPATCYPNVICTEVCSQNGVCNSETYSHPDDNPDSHHNAVIDPSDHALIFLNYPNFQPVEFTNTDCPNATFNEIPVDVRCRWCRDNDDYVSSPGVLCDEYGHPLPRDQVVQPLIVHAPVTPHDLPELQTYRWHVPTMSLKDPELFREIKWDSSATHREETSVSPLSGWIGADLDLDDPVSPSGTPDVLPPDEVIDDAPEDGEVTPDALQRRESDISIDYSLTSDPN